ncbi:Polyadenylate-binding protein RBP47B'-like protein [Drosera capensis]
MPYHQPQTLEEVRTLCIGDLQCWVDEQYLHSWFAPTGEVKQRFLQCVVQNTQVVSIRIIRNKIIGQPEGYRLGPIHFYAKSSMLMSSFLRNHSSVVNKVTMRHKTLVQYLYSYRFYHLGSNPGSNSSNPSIPSSSLVQKRPSRVGIFWDLDNKPPNSVSPFEAATRLKSTVTRFGYVKYMVAYANRSVFGFASNCVKEQKEGKVLDVVENKGVVKAGEAYLCRVCGRKFGSDDKLGNHFKIHEREQQKRLSQIESAKGKKRAILVGKYAMKMEKYRNAVRDVVTPKVGYGFTDELKRARFWVRMVSEKPQAAVLALRSNIVDMMDRRCVECIVLVSNDSDFINVIKEARERCIKTVVVGDLNDGVLKRNADACFSWKEILVGKAKNDAMSVIGKWKDREILKKLEWTYDPNMERDGIDQFLSSDEELDDRKDMEGGISNCDKRDGFWWELDSNVDTAASKS